MIISELKIYNFRQFKSVNGVPGLEITFHKGLNALIGENDSGKSAVIDALKLILLTQSNEYIRPSDEDFYKPVEGEACSELNPFAAVLARLIKVLIGEHIFITAKAFTVGSPFRLTSRHSALISNFMSFLTVHTSSLIYKKIGCAVQSYCRREF